MNRLFSHMSIFLVMMGVMVHLSCAQSVVKKRDYTERFHAAGLDKRYRLDTSLRPSFLAADFNGDQIGDTAVLIAELKTGKRGILVLHGQTQQYFVFGAGQPFGEGDNYQWADHWQVFPPGVAEETQFDEATGDILGGMKHTLPYPSILVEAWDDGAAIAGGIIYWKDGGYRWIHQGE